MELFLQHLLPFEFTCDLRQLVQYPGCHGIPGRHGAVIRLLCPHNKLLPVLCIQIESPAFEVEELFRHYLCPGGCPLQIISPECYLVKLQQPKDIAGIIIQLSLTGRIPVPVAHHQTSILHKVAADKCFCPDSHIHIPFFS